MNPLENPGPGDQRLSLTALQAWEALRFGLFLHFGLSTFTGKELPPGDDPATLYAPDRLDVDQWVCVARDAGMKYAVLTAKHVAGHCLWPSRHTDYHVGNSGNRTDVVEAFVTACAKRGVMPGLYYCSWDNHHTFGSQTPSGGNPAQLAHGISVALYNTLFGIGVAIPAVIFYRHFRNRVDVLVVDMESQAIKLVEILRGERRA